MEILRQILRQYRYGAIALVTVLTLVAVGAVVVTTTSAGCGAATKLGLKTAGCLKAGPSANLILVSPTPAGKGGYVPPTGTPRYPATPSPYNPGASSIPPYNPGGSSNPPYDPGSSSFPPYDPGASANPPYQGPASGGYPPMANPASGSATPTVALTCRLPVYAGGPGSGGFIDFPAQTFVADPRSAVTVPSPTPASTPTPPQMGPGGPAGWYGETYDAAYQKWVPVPWAWVSPDGTHYAYGLGGNIYVQNVVNGTQLELGSGRGYAVIDVENNGVYVTTPNQPGLWFLPLAGAPKQLSTTGFWQGVANGQAYGTPTSSVPQGATNTIERLDLATGTIKPFFSQPGAQSTVLGFDASGRPVIQAYYPQGNAIYIATTDTAIEIAASFYGSYGPYPSGTPIADSHGLWFSVGNGMVLFTGGAWYWMASIGGQLAGQCL